MKDYAIYLDLDGVLADYDGGFRRDHPTFKIDPSLNRSSHLLPGSGSERKRAAYELIKGTTFYANLPLMPGAEKLYNFVRDSRPIILTAAPKFGAGEEEFHINPHWLGAAFHKRNWVETVFLPAASYERASLWGKILTNMTFDQQTSPRPRIRLADDRFICTSSARKFQFMHRKKSEHQILVDDRPDNIEAWRNAGGIGILHTSVDDSIEQLKAL
jgi:hypothetical protein